MSLSFDRHQYLPFLEAIERLKLSVEGLESQELQTAWETVQKNYIEAIAPWPEESMAPRWQSLQTEIHRTYRLLQTDVIFLQASRQKATIQQRQQGCLERLKELSHYCQEILKIEN